MIFTDNPPIQPV